MIKEIFSHIRGLVAYGAVVGVNDGGQAQTVTAQTADGVTRADVEVAQAFGFASVPPSTAGVAVFLAVGADPSNLIALPLTCPAQRMGGLEPGETAIYAADGTRIHLRQGGIIEIWGGSTVTINSPDVVINAPNGVTVNGNITVQGSIDVSVDVVIQGKSVIQHDHIDSKGGLTQMMAN